MSTGGMNLGNATFTVKADIKQLTSQLDDARNAVITHAAALAQLKLDIYAGRIAWSEYVKGVAAATDGLQQAEFQVVALSDALNRATAATNTAAASNRNLASSGGAAAAGTGRAAAATNSAERAARLAAYRFMIFGQTIDDLQYVGQNGMGLRPIINNLMMIHPALGLATIAIDQIIRHGDGLKDALGGIADYWETAGDGAGAAISSMMDGVAGLITQVQKLGKWIGDIAEGWGELTGETKRAREAANDKFFGVGSTADQERGKAVSKGIDAFGREKFFRTITAQRAKFDPTIDRNSPLFRQGDYDREREKIRQMVEKAEKGDSNATEGLLARAKGTVAEGVLAGELPEAKAAEAARKFTEKFAMGFVEGAAKEAEKSGKELEKRADELAGDLTKAAMNRFLDTGKMPDVGGVSASLQKSHGLGYAEADRLAPRVLKRIQEDIDKQIGKRAGEKGIGRSEAAGELAQERIKEEQEKAERRRREAEQDQNRAGAEARESLPAIDEKVQKLMMTFGHIDEGLKKRIESDLKAGGMAAEDAEKGAKDIVEDARRKVNEDVAKSMIQPQTKASFTGIGEMWKSIQVGALDKSSLQKRQIALQETMVKQGEAAGKALGTIASNIMGVGAMVE